MSAISIFYGTASKFIIISTSVAHQLNQYIDQVLCLFQSNWAKCHIMNDLWKANMRKKHYRNSDQGFKIWNTLTHILHLDPCLLPLFPAGNDVLSPPPHSSNLHWMTIHQKLFGLKKYEGITNSQQKINITSKYKCKCDQPQGWFYPFSNEAQNVCVWGQIRNSRNNVE